MLREISMPFKQIKDFEIKQPMLGANYLYGRLIAEPNGISFQFLALLNIVYNSIFLCVLMHDFLLLNN